MNLETAARSLESLGNPTRLSIYRCLVRAGPAGLPVGELRERIQIPGSTLSHHIGHLVAADLVTQNREGRVLRCTARYETMRGLVDFLVAECCAEGEAC